MSAFSVAVVKSGASQFDIYGINEKSRVAMLLETITAINFDGAIEKVKTALPALKDDLFVQLNDTGLDWANGAYEAISGVLVAEKAQEEARREALAKEMEERYGPIWVAFMKQAEREGWAQSHAQYCFMAEDNSGNIFAYADRPVFDTRALTWGSPGRVRGVRTRYRNGDQEVDTETYVELKKIGWGQSGSGTPAQQNRIVERVIDPADVYMTFGKYKDKRVGDMPINYTSYIVNKVTDPKDYQKACVEACKKIVARHNNKKGGA